MSEELHRLSFSITSNSPDGSLTRPDPVLRRKVEIEAQKHGLGGYVKTDRFGIHIDAHHTDLKQLRNFHEQMNHHIGLRPSSGLGISNLNVSRTNMNFTPFRRYN